MHTEQGQQPGESLQDFKAPEEQHGHAEASVIEHRWKLTSSEEEFNDDELDNVSLTVGDASSKVDIPPDEQVETLEGPAGGPVVAESGTAEMSGKWSLSSEASGSPARDRSLSRSRTRSRSRSSPAGAMSRRPLVGPLAQKLPPPPKILGIEHWQQPLYQACAPMRMKLPEVPLRNVRIECLCAGTGGEVFACQVDHGTIYWHASCISR